MDSLSEVKELIPEFYYSSQFLVNVNRFDFGETQSGENVADVRSVRVLSSSSFLCESEFNHVTRFNSHFEYQHLNTGTSTQLGSRLTGGVRSNSP